MSPVYALEIDPDFKRLTQHLTQCRRFHTGFRPELHEFLGFIEPRMAPTLAIGSEIPLRIQAILYVGF